MCRLFSNVPTGVSCCKRGQCEGRKGSRKSLASSTASTLLPLEECDLFLKSQKCTRKRWLMPFIRNQNNGSTSRSLRRPPTRSRPYFRQEIIKAAWIAIYFVTMSHMLDAVESLAITFEQAGTVQNRIGPLGAPPGLFFSSSQLRMAEDNSEGNYTESQDYGDGDLEVLNDLSWRVEKLRLEEQNTKRFLKAPARYLPYDECRKWVIALNRWDTEEEWRDWIEMGEKRNAYIPARPDEYYERQGKWISWNHFLGKDGDDPFSSG